MRLVELIKNIFVEKETVILSDKLSGVARKLAIEDYALQLAINFVAGTMSRLEFKTVLNDKETFGEDYYLWNVRPNANQNRNQFLTELISKLLYYNEVLVIDYNGQMIIADDFIKDDKALIPSRFTSVRRGDITFNRTFYRDEVMYFSNALRNVRSIVAGLLSGYQELLNSSVGKYKRAGGRKGIIDMEITPQKTEEWNRALDDLYNNRFKSYFNEENALVVLPKGLKYQEITGEGSKKSTSEVNDITNITNEAILKTAKAFCIPPSLMVGNTENVDSATDEYLTFCIMKIVDVIESEANRGFYQKAAYQSGRRLYIDTSCIKHRDIFDAAEAADKYIADGILSVDEVRKALKLLPLNTWWSRQHWFTKNYQSIEAVGEGGENHE